MTVPQVAISKKNGKGGEEKEEELVYIVDNEKGGEEKEEELVYILTRLGDEWKIGDKRKDQLSTFQVLFDPRI
jgi:hypothetical protein